MAAGKKTITLWAVAAVAVASFVGVAYFAAPPGDLRNGARVTANAAATDTGTGSASNRAPGDLHASESVELSDKDTADIRTDPVGERDFPIEKTAVGSIDFNQEMSVQVFTPFPGRIISLFAKAGDDVVHGATLFTIDSPDLLEAESKLISAAGTLNVTTHAVDRAKQLYDVQGVSQKDLDQALADHQSAEGALRAARDALRIFGKTDAEMDRVVSDRHVDSVLAVHSPITGRITARNAAPGLFVQPGNAPAPYTVSDISTMWMLANVAETDFPFLQLGEEVAVNVNAYPGRVFRGRVVNIAATVDPNTRRLLVRSEIRDAKHELRPGMFATFLIRAGKTVLSPAVPFAGIVREGDGTMSAWVNTGDGRLEKRTVKVGVQQDGLHQILDGLKPGELVANDGALFLNNALTAESR